MKNDWPYEGKSWREHANVLPRTKKTVSQDTLIALVLGAFLAIITVVEIAGWAA